MRFGLENEVWGELELELGLLRVGVWLGFGVEKSWGWEDFGRVLGGSWGWMVSVKVGESWGWDWSWDWNWNRCRCILCKYE